MSEHPNYQYFFIRQFIHIFFYCRGYVYSRNLELGPGKVAYGNKLLIYRPSAFDNEAENSNFCQIIDPSSLKVNTTLYFSNNNIKFQHT